MSEEGRRFSRARERLGRLDADERLLKLAEGIRRRLPGDSRYGDPLSLAGNEPPHLIGQRLAALSATRPSALREVGLGALQVWQSLSEAQGRGRGDEDLAILFTDLAGFSSWALKAGDTSAVELLRLVGETVEPRVEARGGRVVKRLGDGLMAVFADAEAAVSAALEATGDCERIEHDGYNARLRTGIHHGRPRKLGGDYLGVDVNIAARVAAAAKPGEVLVSEAACARLDERAFTLKKRRFKAKGAPKDLVVLAVEPRA